MKKIANLVFNPFVNDSRVLKVSKSLASNGFLVEVIAHMSDGLLNNETHENFSVKRFSYLDRKKSSSYYKKLKAYLFYVIKSVNYCKKFNYLHCNDLNTLPIGVFVKLLYNKHVKIIYDAHEYETETFFLKGYKKKLAKITEKILIKYVDNTIVVSNSIANEYVRLYSIPKPTVVLNSPFYKLVEKKNVFREKFTIKNEQKIFLYQGGLTEGRGIKIILDTFKDLKEKYVIIFMGYGRLEKDIISFSKKYKNIFYHEAVPPNVLLDYTSSADYGISMIEDTCLNYRYCLPNKVFEYIMAGLPIVVSNLPEMKSLVEEYNVGIAVNDNTPNGLKNALTDLLKVNDKYELCRNLDKAKSLFNWENQEVKLLSVYNAY